jgi:hypothetical protein
MNRKVTYLLSFSLAAGVFAGLCTALNAAPEPGAAGAGAPQGAGAGALRPGARRGGTGGLSLLELPPSLEARLQLTADQKTKLDAIRTRVQGEVRALVGQQGGDRRMALQKAREARQKASTEAMALLTPAQKQQLEGFQSELQQFQGLGRSAPALLAVTGLTDEQKARLKTLAVETQNKRREMFQGLQQGGNTRELGQKMQALETETNAAVKQILNAQQQQQFDAALRNSGPRRGPRRPGTG